MLLPQSETGWQDARSREDALGVVSHRRTANREGLRLQIDGGDAQTRPHRQQRRPPSL
jgi:hypothetical protein